MIGNLTPIPNHQSTPAAQVAIFSDMRMTTNTNGLRVIYTYAGVKPHVNTTRR